MKARLFSITRANAPTSLASSGSETLQEAAVHTKVVLFTLLGGLTAGWRSLFAAVVKCVRASPQLTGTQSLLLLLLLLMEV
jgi:hypothetical protein